MVYQFFVEWLNRKGIHHESSTDGVSERRIRTVTEKGIRTATDKGIWTSVPSPCPNLREQDLQLF